MPSETVADVLAYLRKQAMCLRLEVVPHISDDFAQTADDIEAAYAAEIAEKDAAIAALQAEAERLKGVLGTAIHRCDCQARSGCTTICHDCAGFVP